MNIDEIETFLCIAELGGFTKAAERLNRSTGDVVVLIPKRGYSEHTKRQTHDLAGRDIGPWAQPDVDAVFARVLGEHLEKGRIEELDLHINDAEFADACVDAFVSLIQA